MLSAKRLVEQNQEQQQQLKSTVVKSAQQTLDSFSPASSHKGLKEKFPDKSSTEAEAKEAEKITQLQNELFQMLKQERIERTIGRCQADYDIKNGKVCVRRKIGKWQMFGQQMNDGILQLQNHEALYLIEMNRLELFINSALVSLENAYELLLDKNMTPEMYFVYSELTRAGYILEVFNEKNYIAQKKSITFLKTRELSMIDKCIWQNLYDKLPSSPFSINLTQPRQFMDLSTRIYENIRKSMTQLSDWIKMPSSYHSYIENKRQNDEPTTLIDVGDSWNYKIPVKRKKDNNDDDDDDDDDDYACEPNKKIKLHEMKYRAESFLDFIPIPNEFTKIFKDIQIIHLTPGSYDASVNSENMLNLNFNVYLPNPDDNQKKSHLHKSPGYRILIVGADDPVPNRQSIVQRFIQLNCRTPIIVIFVNQSMAMHAFLYHFSI